VILVGCYEVYEFQPKNSLLCEIHTILEGIIGQCLAALHSHISTLEPDQADSTLHGEYYIPCLRFSADISREMRNKPQHSEQVDCHILAPKGD
jgi:hypothetical protein